jgi:hypothetical protein
MMYVVVPLLLVQHMCTCVPHALRMRMYAEVAAITPHHLLAHLHLPGCKSRYGTMCASAMTCPPICHLYQHVQQDTCFGRGTSAASSSCGMAITCSSNSAHQQVAAASQSILSSVSDLYLCLQAMEHRQWTG